MLSVKVKIVSVSTSAHQLAETVKLLLRGRMLLLLKLLVLLEVLLMQVMKVLLVVMAVVVVVVGVVVIVVIVRRGGSRELSTLVKGRIGGGPAPVSIRRRWTEICTGVG